MELSRYLAVTIRQYFYLVAHSDRSVAGRVDNYYTSYSKIYFFKCVSYGQENLAVNHLSRSHIFPLTSA